MGGETMPLTLLPVPSAISSILGTWLDQYSEDFCQPPDFPCLKQLVAYVQLNMPGSDLERRAHLLLAQLEDLEPSEVEPEALSPAPVLSLKPASQLEPAPALLLTPSRAVASTPVREPAPVPVLASSPVVAPASELEPALEPPLDPEPTLAPAPELDPTVSQSLHLEPAPVPAPALEPSWPLPETTENGLCAKPHLLLFPPDLVAEQFTLMDAVSGSRGRGGAGLLLSSAV
eukprot:XP_006233792.1 PREDICTED: ral guanine nucleotide dissociation stimulator-like [Rattus norvegicus]